MKPDDFSDRIRRKLESVEPEFREKDWTRMQQALGHSTPVFAIGTRAGLMAAASVAAVVAFGGVAYQQFQTSQHLREQVRTLNETVTRLQEKQSADPTPITPGSLPADTVYLTREVIRYVPVPYERKRADETDVGPDLDKSERVAQTDEAPNGSSTEVNSTINPNTTETTTTTTNRSPSSSLNTNRSKTSGSVNEDVIAGSENRVTTNATAKGRTRSGNRVSESTRDGANGQTNSRVDVGSNRVDATTTTTPTGQPESVGNQTTQLSLLAIKPFRYDTAYYQEGIARTARRMRRMLSTLSPAGTALAKVEVNRSEPNWNWRLGTGANLGWRQWSAGLFGELRLNNHFRLGIGLSTVNLEGGTYLTEVDYGKQNKQDFRQKYKPKVAPQQEIISIEPTGSTVRVPLMLSYRVGLGNGWSLVPSVGVNLSLSNREEVRFAYVRGPGVFEPVTLVRHMPQWALHAGMGAVYLEKNWGDWALQLGPYLNTPLGNQPSRLNVQAGGASARLFYQVDWRKKR